MNEARLGAWLQRAALLILLAVAALAALTGNVIVRGEAALEASDRAFHAGELRESILLARRGAVLYAPGAPHVSAAYARLAAIAAGAEASGQSEIAQSAWRAMRAAALETRHFRPVRPDILDRANRNLARLAAREPAPDGSTRPREEGLRRLERDEAPRGIWVLVLSLGFGLGAAGVGLMALRGVSADGTLSRRWCATALGLTLIGVACWTLAVLRA